jgi:hypothetical protein
LVVLKEAGHASDFGHRLGGNSSLLPSHRPRLTIGLVQVRPHICSGAGPQLFSLTFVVVEERKRAAQVTLGTSTAVIVVEILPTTRPRAAVELNVAPWIRARELLAGKPEVLLWTWQFDDVPLGHESSCPGSVILRDISGPHSR